MCVCYVIKFRWNIFAYLFYCATSDVVTPNVDVINSVDEVLVIDGQRCRDEKCHNSNGAEYSRKEYVRSLQIDKTQDSIYEITNQRIDYQLRDDDVINESLSDKHDTLNNALKETETDFNKYPEDILRIRQIASEFVRELVSRARMFPSDIDVVTTISTGYGEDEPVTSNEVVECNITRINVENNDVDVNIATDDVLSNVITMNNAVYNSHLGNDVITNDIIDNVITSNVRQYTNTFDSYMILSGTSIDECKTIVCVDNDGIGSFNSDDLNRLAGSFQDEMLNLPTVQNTENHDEDECVHSNPVIDGDPQCDLILSELPLSGEIYSETSERIDYDEDIIRMQSRDDTDSVGLPLEHDSIGKDISSHCKPSRCERSCQLSSPCERGCQLSSPGGRSCQLSSPGGRSCQLSSPCGRGCQISSLCERNCQLSSPGGRSCQLSSPCERGCQLSSPCGRNCQLSSPCGRGCQLSSQCGRGCQLSSPCGRSCQLSSPCEHSCQSSDSGLRQISYVSNSSSDSSYDEFLSRPIDTTLN